MRVTVAGVSISSDLETGRLVFSAGTDLAFCFDRYDGSHSVALWSEALAVGGAPSRHCILCGQVRCSDETCADKFQSACPEWVKRVDFANKAHRAGFRIVLAPDVDIQAIQWSGWDDATREYWLGYDEVRTPGNIVPLTCSENPDAAWCWDVIPIVYANPEQIKNVLTALADKTGKGVSVGVYQPSEKLGPRIAGIPEKVSLSLQTFTDLPAINGTSPNSYIAVSGSGASVEWARQVIAKLDVPPELIELEVRVCEFTESGLKDLGIEVGKNGTWLSGVSAGFKEDGRPGVDSDRQFEAFSLGDMFRSSGLDLTAVLTALKQQGKVRILAQPTLTTLDGQEAQYFVGESVPFISAVANSASTASNPATVEYKNVGVLLQFLPRLDQSPPGEVTPGPKTITIRVQPAISSLGELLSLGGGAVAPKITLRQVESTVRVQDGEPFVLAGLIKDEERKSVNKLLLLGDLPLVGELFKHTHTEKTHSEICIIVIPRVRCEPGV